MSGMKWYIARRIIWTFIVLWITLSITWGLLEMSPNSGELRAAQQAAMAGGNASEAMEDFRKSRGLNAPWHERYMDYMVNMYTLNWGYSDHWDQNVIQLLTERWPFSFQYAFPAAILTMIFGYGIGVYSALNQYTKSDYVATFLAFFGLSIPNFWFAIVLVLIAGVWFQDAVVFGVSLSAFKLPVFYKTQVISDSPWLFKSSVLSVRRGWFSVDNLKQILIPIVVISTAGFASNARYSRAYVLEYANSEFVKTARAKGADGVGVAKHILRVAIVPLMTILVFDFLNIFVASTLVIEFIFSIPGLGLITFQSFLNQDTPVILANTVLGVALALLGYLLQDLAYVYLDPRIDYGDRTGGAR